jgi:hypothetical protein
MDRNLWNLIEGVSITKEPDSWSYSNGDMYTVRIIYSCTINFSHLLLWAWNLLGLSHKFGEVGPH